MLLEVGRVVRPHALGGEVVVELLTNRRERLEPGSVLYGGSRELQVSRAREFKGRWIVSFEGCEDLEAAERLRGVSLRAAPIPDEQAIWVHDLIGSVVRSTSGEHLGEVRSVVANPASDLMELEDGALVPVCFVVDRSPGLVVVEVPPGLLD